MAWRRRLGWGLALALLAPWPDGRAVPSSHDQVVSSDPADATPHVLDGKVTAILPMGPRVYVGGTFTQVRDAGTTTVLPRRGLFALDQATHRVVPDFVADFDGVVEALAPAPDGAALFVGGDFDALNGSPLPRLAKISASDGRPVAGFSASVDQSVRDLAVVPRGLVLVGTFTRVNGERRQGLAALSVDTGALDAGVDIPFTDPRVGERPRVEAVAATPDGTTLVVGGNFLRAGGQPRGQVALVDLAARQAGLVEWSTERYTPRDPATGKPKCKSFDNLVRDIEVAPDGSYFVVVTTGAFSRGNLCDTAARWELAARGESLQPTWADFSGGDSFTGVAISGSAIYVGGHQRWMNNPFPSGTGREGSPGPGNVPREGIAALDPLSGLPLPWNPGRERGEGAWAVVATPDGLWVGGDTDRIGAEFHQKLAFFPLAGGTAPPRPATQPLPGELSSIGLDGSHTWRTFDGSALGPRQVGEGGADWSTSRGALLVSGRLLTGQEDGRLLAHPVGGGPSAPAEVDLRGLTATHFPVAKLTGMFYEGGRLYYSVAGDPLLYWRSFLPEGRVEDVVVGADTFVASREGDGVDWSRVEGMTFASGRIFFAESGDLHRIDLVDGVPRADTRALVARGAEAGSSFASRGLFLGPAGSSSPARAGA